MAKPRVHDIAAQAGIDTKQALRLLREMGEYVKSPSSTLELTVARRLRVAAEAAKDERVRRPAPLPSPPPRDVPHPDTTPVARRVPVKARSAHASSKTNTNLVYTSSTPAPVVMPAVSSPTDPVKQPVAEEPEPEEGTLAALAKQLGASPEAMAKILRSRGYTRAKRDTLLTPGDELALRRAFDRAPARSMRTALSASGSSAATRMEHAISTARAPKSTDATRPGASVAVLPQEPIARWSAVRKNILLRNERGWERFGFSSEEKATWNAAGIPSDKAHIAAMLLRSGIVETVGASTETLDMPVSFGDTLRREALSGKDGLQLRQAVLATTGRPIGEVSEDLTYLLGWNSKQDSRATSDALRGEILQVEISPKKLPALADAMSNYLTSSTPQRRAWSRLAGAARSYVSSRAVAPLLREFAHAHAIFHKDTNLRQLCEAVVDYDRAVWRVETPSPASELFASAATGRYFVFLDDGVHDALDEGGEKLPPPPQGVAYIRETVGEDRLLVWSTGIGGIECAIFALSDFDEGSKSPTIYPYRAAAPAEPARLLRAITALRAPVSQPARSRPGHSKSGSPVSPPAATSVSTPSATALPVVLHYRCDPTGVVGPSHARQTPDHRWNVRGHWRRQYQPSTKAHKTIWIENHTSGPAGKSLIRVERVDML